MVELTAYPPRVPSPAELAPIEPGIRPVCDALNAIPGVVTLWSCEGHPYRTTPPYVTFTAPQKTAFRIQQQLDHGIRNGQLQYCWWVVATFQDDGSLKFTIEPNDYRLRASTPRLLLLFQIPAWSNSSMQRELQQMAALLAS